MENASLFAKATAIEERKTFMATVVVIWALGACPLANGAWLGLMIDFYSFPIQKYFWIDWGENRMHYYTASVHAQDASLLQKI